MQGSLASMPRARRPSARPRGAVAKLDSLDLVERRESAAVITAKGKAMTDRVDAARERTGGTIFETWDPREVLVERRSLG